MSALRTLRAVLIAGAVWVLAARAAEATTVVPVTLEQLAARADDVLVVIPRAQHSQWIAGRIDTDWDLEVLSVMRGSVAAHTHVVLRTPGGVVGTIGQSVPGVPSLAIGQTYVVFVSAARGDPSLLYLTHLTASVLAVNTMPDGTVTVAPPLGGMTTGAPSTAMRPTGLPIDAFVAAVRSAR